MRTHSAESASQRGVTLLELVVALAACLIVASIGVPAYSGYVLRARTAVAVGDIGRLSLHLYRWQLGTRSFPATLAEAGIDGAVDPWGRAYVYQRVAGANNGDLRKDKNLVPINTDFDLYSMGPDGETMKPLTAAKARDDIVRANDGAYIGRAELY